MFYYGYEVWGYKVFGRTRRFVLSTVQPSYHTTKLLQHILIIKVIMRIYS